MKKLALLLFATTCLYANEGMWMPSQMPQLAGELKALGITMDPKQLADLTGDPLGAVVSIPGCTASFVSPDGLIVTNHHCAFGSIQYNSSADRDLITNGFLAKTRADELPAAPGTKVWVTTNIEDVTARVNAGINAKTSDVERAKLLDRREKELIAECEKPGGVRCRVAPFFEGSQVLRTTERELTDVRLVYAPSAMIGDFGGEVDNFEWPRHTGDFSFFRAYLDGQPYHPKHWLKVATQGVRDGDAVIVAGYPGRTFRYKTADEVKQYEEFIYPVNIRYFRDTIHLLEEAGKAGRDVQIRNASRIRSLANALKNYESVSEGFAKDHILEARQAREAKMLAAYPEASAVMGEIARLNAQGTATQQRDLVLDWLVGRASPMLQQAFTAVRLATERPKADIERRARYQERDWANLKSTSDRAQKTIDVPSDRAVMQYFLAEAAKMPESQRVAALSALDLDKLYAGTKIGDQADRTKMLGESVAQLKARKDTMLDLAFALLPLYEQREAAELATNGAMARVRPTYFELLRKMSGGTLYPDANSTLRLTIGKVEGYSPKDALHFTPRTTLRGVLEKVTGKDPFEAPQTFLDAAKDSAKTKPYVDPELGDVPVNFLSTCDTTGGNSGSPTLNAKGELVGLLFDGNYESIDADFLFTQSITRSIHVDAQYMLWIMDTVDGAHELMKELGVTPKQ